MTTRNTAEGREAQHVQYEALALEARSAAASEPLENARQKHLTSAATWEHLARAGRKMGELRDRRITGQLAPEAAPKGRSADPLFLATTRDAHPDGKAPG
jgi:hypothetical protein